MFLETILADAVHVEQAARPPASPVAGRWRNRLGSTIELRVEEGHHLHGAFHTEVGAASPVVSFPVSGFVEGDAVTFCVDFGQRGSVAAWAGHHVAGEDGEHLTMLWHLARPVTDPHSDVDVWAALLAGGDTFQRLS